MVKINQRIKKISRDISNLNYDSLFNFIKEAKELSELRALKEQKLLYKVAQKSSNKRVFSAYIQRVKELDKSQYIYEKNYIVFLFLIIKRLDDICKEIDRSIPLLCEENIYTNLYRLGKYNEINKLKAYELMLNHIICDKELITKEKIDNVEKKKAGLNIDKFTRIYSEKNFENERIIALANSIILNKKCKYSEGYFNDFFGKEHFDKVIQLISEYESIYNFNDEITYGRYVVKKVIGNKLYLKFANINLEKSRITGQRRENVRRELAKHNGINDGFFHYYNAIINDVVNAEKRSYEESDSGKFYVSVEEMIENVRNIINEEINYEDINLYIINDKHVQISYLILVIMICQWSVVSKLIPREDDDFSKYYYPINFNLILEYILQFGINVEVEEIKNIFFDDIKNPNAYSLLYNPFITLSNGSTHAIYYLVERMDWSLFIRRKILNGGKVAKTYGDTLEKLIEETFDTYNWSLIKRGYKIKIKNEVITDCDLIVYKNGLLLLIQIKSSTKGKSPYDNWCILNTIKKGIEQCQICAKYINKESLELEKILKDTEIIISDIKEIQPIVVTPNCSYNGITIENIPVVNFGYLISLLNGAKVEAMNENFEVKEVTAKYLEENWKSSDFVNLLTSIFDWKIDLDGYKVDELKILIRDISIFKPQISEKTVRLI